jgi:hypothetical protein
VGRTLTPGTPPWASRVPALSTTVSTEKDKRVLGYNPVDEIEETILAAVAWRKVDMAEADTSPVEHKGMAVK